MSVDPGDQTPERPRRVLPAALALVVLLALVALAARGRPLGIGRGGDGPSTTFIDYAWTTLVIVFVFWIALAFWYAWEMRGHVAQQPQQARRWWLMIPFFALIVVLAFTALRAAHFRPLRTPTQTAQQETNPNEALLRKKPKGSVHNADFRWEELAAILGGLAVLGAVLIARRRGSNTRSAFRLRAATGVSAALDEAVDDLRNEPDVRRAIIAAYARTERALALHGLPRRRAEAPLEYLERALAELEASADSIRRLTDLFERAKFSKHEPEPGMKDEAIDALLAVRDELRQPAREPVAA